jgi:ArsR family transcriptional regulator
MSRTTDKQLDDQIYERQVAICKAFANPIRLRILDMLSNGGRNGSHIQETLGVSKANLSQHLAILRSAGVIVTRRDGKQIHCALAIPEVKQACSLIRNVLRAQIRHEQRLAR